MKCQETPEGIPATISFRRVWKQVNEEVPVRRCFHDTQGKATEGKSTH